MPEPFKNKINEEMIQVVARQTQKAWPKFDSVAFALEARRGLEALELKGRIDHLTRVWRRYLPKDYLEALRFTLKTLPPEFNSEAGWGDVVFYSWLHSHFIQIFGLEFPDESLAAMVEITKRGSCEFAVRPYLVKHPERTRAFLRRNLEHPSPHVRRWISEGTRPRLPWGERLQHLVEDPAPNIPLLQALRKDSSEYVRTSVANHLGDIAKDHPEVAVRIASEWIKEGFPHAEWIAKRGLRHLIKNGHPGALEALGFSKGTQARLSDLKLMKKRVQVGEDQSFQFSLTGSAGERLSIDYAVDYRLARGVTGRKVFKLAAKPIEKGQTLQFSKKHSFKPVSIRTLYPGEHAIVILVNGTELGRAVFQLVA
ncbi:MAG: DNA alkylation repair protein [Verrucomicrobia bacterium]|nr:DNA alkylation repair protein [Verrucomicrobiota bacterium]